MKDGLMTPAEQLEDLAAVFRRDRAGNSLDPLGRIGRLLNLTILAVIDQERRIAALERQT